MGWTGPVTNRVFNVWKAWFRAEWDNPNRTDHYIMQAAQAQAGGKLGEYRLDWNKAYDAAQEVENLDKPKPGTGDEEAAESTVEGSAGAPTSSQEEYNGWLKAIVQARIGVSGPRPNANVAR